MAQIYLKNWCIRALMPFFLGMLSSCTSTLMNQQTYNQINVGMSVEEVQAIAGQPYRITNSNPSLQNYEYIERFEVGAGRTHQNTYILTIQEGRVINKQLINEAPSQIGIQWQ